MKDHSVSDKATPENLADESRALSRSSFAALLGVLLSRFSGLLRSQVVTAIFGASPALSAFYLANRFPSALRDLFAEGALSAAFTKTYVEVRSKSEAEAKQVVALVTVVFGVVTLLIAFLCVAFAREFVTMLSDKSYSASGEGFELATVMFRFLGFYLPIAMLSSIAMMMLTVIRQTFRATVASAFFNVGTILGAVAIAPLLNYLGFEPIMGLVVGTLAGGVFQFLYQVWPLFKRGLFPNPLIVLTSKINFQPIFDILKLMGPRVLSQGANIIALFINTNFATMISAVALVYITNAQTIILVPVGLFGVAAGIASAPVLSQAVVDGDTHKFSRLLSESLNSAQWLALVTIIGFALFIYPVSSVLFEHGRYTRADVFETALAIHAYGAAIFFNASTKVLQPAFFALGDTRQVMVNSVVYLAINATLSFLLAPRYGIVGLGVSNSIAAASDFCLSYFFLKRLAKRKQFLNDGQLYKAEQKSLLPRVMISALAALLSIFFGIVLTKHAWRSATSMLTWWQLGFIALAGGLVYLFVCFLLTRRFGPASLVAAIDRLLVKVKRAKRA